MEAKQSITFSDVAGIDETKELQSCDVPQTTGTLHGYQTQF